MRPTLRTLSEEVVRWGFEVTISQKGGHVFVAFSNPTAGPWKWVCGRDAQDHVGNVHRFQREERRPDLIIVNDVSKFITIIEAKQKFSALAESRQLESSSEMFNRMSLVLKRYAANSYWGERSHYRYVFGILWSSGSETREDVDNLCRKYLTRINSDTGDVVCIEGSKSEEALIYRSYWGISGQSAEVIS